jgi:hypothetical protein
MVPALKIDGKLHKGAANDSHNTIGLSIGVESPPEASRGFVVGGQFLTRKQALGFLKTNDPETYRKLPKEALRIGLHSEFLAKALGIKQKPVAVKIIAEARDEREERTPEAKKPLSEMTAIVYDRGGLYLYCAEKLAEKYGKVLYYLADSDAYPTSQKSTIGSGIPKVKRIHDLWKFIDSADIIYFFDCYDGQLQHWLREKGYKVFGSGLGEKIEIDKIFFLETLEKLGLPCPKTYVAEGMDDLCKYLKDHDGETLFLKNLHRGDFESRKFTSMAQSRPFLNDLKKRLGSASDTIEVLVQHKIDSVVEVGYDGYLVDGEFTTNCIVGYEIKDRGFVAKVFKETPEIVGSINTAFGPILKKLGGRGNYSTEIRVTAKGEQFYIDPTQRVPSPPGELQCEIYENWAEATYQIACGELPEFKPKAMYGAEVTLTSAWADEHEIHVKFPPKFKQHIKLKNHTIRDGEYYCIPNGNGAFFGAVVAWSDTLQKAIDKVCEVCEAVEADEYSFDKSVFDEAMESVEKGKKFGVLY